MRPRSRRNRLGQPCPLASHPLTTVVVRVVRRAAEPLLAAVRPARDMETSPAVVAGALWKRRLDLDARLEDTLGDQDAAFGLADDLACDSTLRLGHAVRAFALQTRQRWGRSAGRTTRPALLPFLAERLFARPFPSTIRPQPPSHGILCFSR